MEEGDGAIVDISDLGTITRILFATDGAITHILEAYAGEAVDLVTVTSSVGSGPSSQHDLDGGTDVDSRNLRRRTLLQGRDSGRVFVHADSVVRLDRIPEPVAAGLSQPGASLLALLTQNRIGTFRESVREWEGTDEAIAACFRIDPGEVLVARTYQVVLAGRPVAWITESFPKDGFTSPPSPPRPPEASGRST